MFYRWHNIMLSDKRFVFFRTERRFAPGCGYDRRFQHIGAKAPSLQTGCGRNQRFNTGILQHLPVCCGYRIRDNRFSLKTGRHEPFDKQKIPRNDIAVNKVFGMPAYM